MLSLTDIKFFKLAVGSENIGKETELDVNAKCPVCGDGKKKNSKRLHLYDKNGTTLVNCFNGDCSVHSNLWNFLKMYYPDLLDSYKRETFGETMKSLSNPGSFGTFNSNKPKEEIKLETVPLEPYFSKIEENSEAVDYLKNRCIDLNEIDKKFGQWYVGKQDLNIDGILYKVQDSIILPLYFENKIYGFYSRSIKQKNFVTYNHSKNIGYKIWNWFNIDKTAPVFIFEGIFDAISSGKKNIIALIGAKIPADRLKELTNPVFCLDNDKTGIENAKNYAKLGYNVYIQPNEIQGKDFNEIKKAYPNLNISNFINENIFKGIQALVKLTTKN